MEPTTKRHPVLGLLYGVVLGLGLAMVVVGQGIAALGTWPPLLVFVGGIIAGFVWSMYGPAKAAADPPPSAAQVIEDQPVHDTESSDPSLSTLAEPKTEDRPPT